MYFNIQNQSQDFLFTLYNSAFCTNGQDYSLINHKNKSQIFAPNHQRRKNGVIKAFKTPPVDNNTHIPI